MKNTLVILCLLVLACTVGCVSDVPSHRRIKAEIREWYETMEKFNRTPVEITVLEIMPSGEIITAVVDVEGDYVHQVDVDFPKKFAAKHELEFLWIGAQWRCIKHVPTDYSSPEK